MEENFTALDKAKAFAEMVHKGHHYAGVADNYGVHLADNVSIAQEVGLTDVDSEIIGHLHDTIEDIHPALREMARLWIRENFSAHVYETVWAMTGVGKNRRERNANYYFKIEIYPNAADHKVVDRIANMRQSKDSNEGLWKMYMKEDPEFHSRVVKLASARVRAAYNELTGRTA